MIEEGIKEGWIVTVEDINLSEIAERAGVEEAEAIAVTHARSKRCPVLLDDLAARRFAIGLDLEVVGSVGTLDALEKLAKVMWNIVEAVELYLETAKDLGIRIE